MNFNSFRHNGWIKVFLIANISSLHLLLLLSLDLVNLEEKEAAMTVEEIIRYLKEIAEEKYRLNVIKLGIPEENSIGVPTTELRKLAKKIPRDKDFILSLWAADYHEGKILAVLALNPAEYTELEIDHFMKGIHSWDLCDLFCKTVLIKNPNYSHYVFEWIKKPDLFYKRAAFTLIASTSTHDQLEPQELSGYLQLIHDYSDDDRLLVKKAVSWALRELGKSNETAKNQSIHLAKQLVESADKNQRWIGKDALKELETLVKAPGRSRLISNKSKMGKEINEKEAGM